MMAFQFILPVILVIVCPVCMFDINVQIYEYMYIPFSRLYSMFDVNLGHSNVKGCWIIMKITQYLVDVKTIFSNTQFEIFLLRSSL